MATDSKEPCTVFTSESVTEGHPDKVCDQISDAIVDECLRQDPQSRVAVEVAVKNDFVALLGEVTTKADVDYAAIARRTVERIGFHTDAIEVRAVIDRQSPEIAAGVDTDEQGAGDQGLMFGFACDETPSFMPLPIVLAHGLTRRLAELRRTELPWLRPDGKAQVSVAYRDGRPVAVTTVVLAAQHAEHVGLEEVRAVLSKRVIDAVVPVELRASDMKRLVNAAGPFTIGGPRADAGLTGRKIIVDTYGGVGRVGGGAFSGKDPSKVDRSAAYAARWVAKNIVAAGLAQRCEVQVAYAIGVAEPVSIAVDTFGAAAIDEARIEAAVRAVFDLRPAAIIRDLRLLRPIYESTASGGHFGRVDSDFNWEQVDRVVELRAAAGLELKTW